MFYSEIRAAGERIVDKTLTMVEEVMHAYDAAAWWLGRPRRDMNFHDCKSREEAKFPAGPTNVVTTEQRHCQRALQRPLAVADTDERAMKAWHQAFPQDVTDENAFFA
jgi:hypothetical protein